MCHVNCVYYIEQHSKIHSGVPYLFCLKSQPQAHQSGFQRKKAKETKQNKIKTRFLFSLPKRLSCESLLSHWNMLFVTSFTSFLAALVLNEFIQQIFKHLYEAANSKHLRLIYKQKDKNVCHHGTLLKKKHSK